ncbi:MAG: T9SS type A sorting domain-containing protein, partial [Cyclobacteriaceae bacterium]|nr:T9SS type A sorting domain-containing protein [Cyclobacteriaceae bacterium]
TASGITSFVPGNKNEWRTESYIDLTAYAGMSNIQLIFSGTNGYNNNLYLDNIYLSSQNGEDLALTSVISPSVISCNPTPVPSVQVFNKGGISIQSFRLSWSLDGSAFTEKFIDNITIIPGARVAVPFDQMTLSDGIHTLEVTISSPNGATDTNPLDNTILHTFYIDTEIDKIPVRVDFESATNWKTFAVPDAISFTEVAGAGTNRIKFPGYGNGMTSGNAWFFSPVLDFSHAEKASLFFDMSYSPGIINQEQLLILLSTDCGQTFPNILYQKDGTNLATTDYQQDFIPSKTTEWRNEYIRLTPYIAGEENVRLAFMVNNAGGNNLYLDNIEIFQDDNPYPLKISDNISPLYPNPSSTGKVKATFNLVEKGVVKIMVYDRLGRRVYNQEEDNILNQTVEINLQGQSQGLYFIHIQGDNFSTIERFLILH